MVLEAPLVMTFCADWYRTRTWLRRRGARDNFANLLGYHVAAYDAMIVAQNVCLGFEARGLGICYMGTTLHSLPELVDFLQLPKTVVPVTSVVVGYPAEDPPKRDRLPIAALLHDETYRAPTPADIDSIYAEREVKGWQRYMGMPELRLRIEAAGISSLARVLHVEDQVRPRLLWSEVGRDPRVARKPELPALNPRCVSSIWSRSTTR